MNSRKHSPGPQPNGKESREARHPTRAFGGVEPRRELRRQLAKALLAQATGCGRRRSAAGYEVHPQEPHEEPTMIDNRALDRENAAQFRAL